MKNKSIKYKIFIIILVLLTIFTLFYVVFADENANNVVNTTNRTLSLQEQQNQVNEQLANAHNQLLYVESELSASLVQIQKLEDKISEYQKKVDEVNAKYQELQSKVTTYEKQLSNIQAQYDKKDKLLKDRLVQMYKRGTTSYLDVLLSSRDIIEFISNYFIIQQVVEYDSKTLKEIEEKKQESEKITNELKEAKANMKLTKVEAEKQTIILSNTKTILENQKTSLTESEQKISAEIDSYKKQQEELENLINYAINGSNYELQYSGGVMIWPTLNSSYITSPFGTRLHPIQGIIKNHDGIDIGGSIGNPVYASADGLIIYSNYNTGGYGNMVMIDHGTNAEGIKIVTLYGHGNKLLKNVGDVVKQGDLIMEMGSTGNSTGPHVHFEVRENGIPTDPKKYLSSN